MDYSKEYSVILKSYGGLGNQLMQFFYAYTLSKEFNRTISIDLSYYLSNNFPYHLHDYYPFKLDLLFDIENKFYCPNYYKFLSKKSVFQIHNLLEQYLNYSGLIILKDNSEPIPRILNGKNLFLDGYWSSKKIDLTGIDKVLNKTYIDKCETIKTLNGGYISVHIRGGDYLTNPDFKEKFNSLDPDYYQKALRIVSKELGLTKVLVFTNSPDYAKELIIRVSKSLKDLHFTIFQSTGDDILDHIHLSKGGAIICANSTYSYSAAYLGSLNESKTIIAPKKWFTNAFKNKKIYSPEHWITI